MKWALFRMGRPVLNLNYLLDTIVQKIKPLDWDVFWEKQLTSKITLKVSLHRLPVDQLCYALYLHC